MECQCHTPGFTGRRERLCPDCLTCWSCCTCVWTVTMRDPPPRETDVPDDEPTLVRCWRGERLGRTQRCD